MRRLLAVATVAACVLAACSDDGGSTDSSASPTPNTPFPTLDVAGSTPSSTVSPATSTVGSGGTVATTEPASTIALDQITFTRTFFPAALTGALGMAWRENDPTIYAVEQRGRVVAIRDSNTEQPIVLDIRDQVSRGDEQGLLGLAFHPTEPYAYIDYTDKNGDTVVAEYPVSSDGVFDESGARVVLTVDQPYENHNGGHITFGPDGFLYIGLGDGGAGGDPQRHALDLSSPLGKLLRIDPRPSGAQSYTVPTDNPFVGVAGARPDIWSYGLRNPWRFEFDSATGDLWIADVGQNEWEEIDVSPATAGAGKGVDFGWSALEGTHRYNEDQSPDGAVPPVFEYSHSATHGCSITGGTVYRGTAIPSLTGWYVFSDYCDATLYAFRLADGTVVPLDQADGNVTAIRAGPDGELYGADAARGIFRLDPA